MKSLNKDLPKRSEFKFILRNNSKVDWEERENRSFDISIINYTLRTSKNLSKIGYALLDQRTMKVEYIQTREIVILTHKWGV